MHFLRFTLITKKTKQAGPLVFDLAPHHWDKTPLPSDLPEHYLFSSPSADGFCTSTPRLSYSTETLNTSSTGTSSRTRSEEDLTLREYQLFNDRASQRTSGPIDEDDRQLGHKHNMFLIPLDMAARMDSIKYRMEGFEMQEHRKHIKEVIRDD